MDSNRKAPSGYFRWIIVLCSFINHITLLGVLMSLSLLYVYWLEEFQESKSVTSWTLSLVCSILQAFCPVPAILASRFGFRAVAFVGGLLTSVGLIASVWAQSVFHFTVLIGIVSGVGCSFCYLPSIAMVALHFDDRRSLAMGIATTGGGVGALVFAPLLNYLIETYTWRGALLVLGGITLNMCATGLLLRPTSEKTFVEEHEREIKVGSTDIGKEKEAMIKKETNDKNKIIIVPDIQLQLVDSNVTDVKRYNQNSGGSEAPLSLKPILLKKILNVEDDPRMHSSLNELGPKRVPSPHSSFPNLNQPRKRKKSHESLVKSLRNIDTALLASASGFHLLEDAPEVEERHEILQLDGLEQPSQETDKSECSVDTRFQAISSLKTNLDMLRDKAFFTFCVSNFLTSLSYFPPIFYLVDRAVHQGISIATGSILLSASGCGNILGRAITGLVADCDCCSNRMLIYIVALCTQGIGTMLSCLCGDIAILHGIFAFYYGYHMGIYTVLLPLVTIDLKGRSNVSTAYGLVLFFMGVASLMGPPFSGFLFDLSRSYEWSYITNGLLLITSGVLVIPLLWRRRMDKHLDEA